MAPGPETQIIQLGLKSGRTFIIRGQLDDVRSRVLSSENRLETFELQDPDGMPVSIAPDAVESIRPL